MSGEESQFNVQGYNIVTILKRLEAATSRLEDITVFQEEANRQKNGAEAPAINATHSPQGNSVSDTLATVSSASSVSPGGVTSHAKDVPAEKKKSILAFEQFIHDFVVPFVNTSNHIDPVVGESAKALADTFVEQTKFLEIVSESKKPDMTDPLLGQVLAPTNEKITKINSLKDENRRSTYFNHLNALSESGAVFFWIGIETPVSYISDIKDSAKFWSDRVLKEYKDKDKVNVDWVNQLTKIFDELNTYVKEYHTKGPAWNGNGKPFAQAVEEFNSTAKAGSGELQQENSADASGPPAPPPPPPASFFEESSASSSNTAESSAGGMNAVFAQLNQGANVTSGLKKVDKSEMTHKNPELRKQPPVAPKKPKNLSGHSTSTQSTPTTLVKKAPKKELIDGSKWIIQNFTQNDVQAPIIIETENSQSVFIGNCSDVTIQLKGKANAVTISETKKVGVVLDSLISGVEIIKSHKYGLQVIGLVPMISIDQSDEGSIYLSTESIDNDCQIYTSKTTALNVNVPEANNDFKELAVPDQIVSTVKNGVLSSSIVEHAG
ncbi:Srv2 adenylate cyclase-associated protein [Candida orthopsilosis Co 90-125]|uniref:Adenylyl cyclase-associated protein n=1 Tax=Candida orthopsilosis (strain 90-125) TaxID=1136231 RepID=H8X4X5_CANO9|nr:Srv2 adenylate cyclase-associated protein [Candida orthopsilosis Co 90-125]CCG23068.1 Srv2 adenylate cyclase-associated protein [Candida orthopsilosis Co 90-125]